MTDKDHNELIEFRLAKLEEAVANLSTIKDTVLKWDSMMQASGNNFLQCNVHRTTMENFEKRLTVIEEDMSDMKKFVYKATGALVVISIVIQLVGPMILDHFKTDHKPVAVQSDSSGGYWVGKTNWNQ